MPSRRDEESAKRVAISSRFFRSRKCLFVWRSDLLLFITVVI